MIHRSLLPQRSPEVEGYELAVKSFAAGTVGGDSLVFYTDGITEAANAEGAMFGESQLIALARTCQADSADILVGKILQEVGRFTGKSTFDDDLTIIAIRKK